jgi:hypothetical protein
LPTALYYLVSAFTCCDSHLKHWRLSETSGPYTLPSQSSLLLSIQRHPAIITPQIKWQPVSPQVLGRNQTGSNASQEPSTDLPPLFFVPEQEGSMN